jgi:hypothetical protein
MTDDSTSENNNGKKEDPEEVVVEVETDAVIVQHTNGSNIEV